MDFAELRRQMVERQLIPRGINSPAVLKAMRKIERHKFVPAEYINSAYGDHPLPIGMGQTISQPYIVALMTQALSLTGDESVLEIGTGSGYQTAVLAELAKKVYSVERLPELSERARPVLAEMGYKNIEFRVGDGSSGWSERSPYDSVMITASCPGTPKAALRQLKEGGRLVAPIGAAFGQVLTIFNKENGAVNTREICGCMFVPLVGKDAWPR